MRGNPSAQHTVMKPPSLWQRVSQWLHPASSGLRSQATRAPKSTDSLVAPERASPATGTPQSHKQLRQGHREQLQVLIREILLRHGILSTAYSFNALTLDRAGQHFIILFDLDGHDIDTRHNHLLGLELDIQRLTQERLPHLQVKHVYWRVTHAIETRPTPSPDAQPEFAPTQPMEHTEGSAARRP